VLDYQYLPIAERYTRLCAATGRRVVTSVVTVLTKEEQPQDLEV